MLHGCHAMTGCSFPSCVGVLFWPGMKTFLGAAVVNQFEAVPAKHHRLPAARHLLETQLYHIQTGCWLGSRSEQRSTGSLGSLFPPSRFPGARSRVGTNNNRAAGLCPVNKNTEALHVSCASLSVQQARQHVGRGKEDLSPSTALLWCGPSSRFCFAPSRNNPLQMTEFD